MFGGRTARLLRWGALAVALFVGYTNLVVLSYRSHIATDIAPQAVVLVFGGGMKSETEMSTIQTERVKKGIELFKSGKVQTLVMTGDDGQFHANEVGAMRDYAIAAGVPAEKISLDPHGYRTYESCRRAKQVYGWTTVVVVSQSFHLPRIAYLCDHVGVSVVGIAAPYPDEPQGKTHLREILARVKAWLDVEIKKPAPPVALVDEN